VSEGLSCKKSTEIVSLQRMVDSLTIGRNDICMVSLQGTKWVDIKIMI